METVANEAVCASVISIREFRCYKFMVIEYSCCKSSSGIGAGRKGDSFWLPIKKRYFDDKVGQTIWGVHSSIVINNFRQRIVAYRVSRVFNIYAKYI